MISKRMLILTITYYLTQKVEYLGSVQLLRMIISIVIDDRFSTPATLAYTLLQLGSMFFGAVGTNDATFIKLQYFLD